MFDPFQLWSPASPHAHLWITYGWLLVCSLAPIVAVLNIWATCIHYTYRQKWRTLDVLLAATFLQELPNALSVFVVGAIKSSLVHLPRHLQAHSVLCYILVWASVASRFYQFAIVTSLIADRALILKWPYQYRFAVRHSQIRLYLISLAFVASGIGGLAVYSHQQQSESILAVQGSAHNATTNLSSLWAVSGQSFSNNQTTNFNSSHSLTDFSYDPATLDMHFNYAIFGLYASFVLVCAVSFLYVECTRPRAKTRVSSKNRYLPSIATLFTTATTSSTDTSTSSSSSLSASSPLPSRFSSLANLTNVPTKANSKSAQNGPLPSYYYPNVKPDNPQNATATRSDNADTLQSLYPISIVDMSGHESGPSVSNAYPSMGVTDVYRLIDRPNGNSRSNSLSLTNENKNDDSAQLSSTLQQHRSTISPSGQFSPTDPTSSLDPLNPASRVNSFSKPHFYSSSSQLKLNTSDSNDSFTGHRSAFDLRWFSVIGPVTFCVAFNHGPYLVFSLLAILFPGIWTPFHDLILVALSLFEALLLPLIVCISDENFRHAFAKSCICGQTSKISSSKRHKTSLAFSDRNLITTPYLKSAANSCTPNKEQSRTLNNYQSDLDLSKKDHSSGKLHKISFLKHHGDLSKPIPSHATSMLDLSSRTPYHNYQASRSRHSLALLQQLPNNSLTPKSSFRRRPPSVASYHYLLSNQYGQPQSKSKYGHYLFGATPSKSESTLSVSSNHFSPPPLIGNSHLNDIKENEADNSVPLDVNQLDSTLDTNSVSSSFVENKNILSRQISDPMTSEKSGPNSKSGPKLKELFTGLTTRTSFKKRSIRKCGSDVSTFYTRQNLKRSQIANNQLSNILYSNFYHKKISPVFGSQINLLGEGDFKELGKDSSRPLFSQLQARQLSCDFGRQASPQFASPHVYLPNVQFLDANSRSNSCQQLTVLTGDTGHYHNHLLHKQSLTFGTDSNGHNSPRIRSSIGDKEYGENNCVNDDEHIYASLPEEEEEEIKEEEENGKVSDSFSAQSTLPDTCLMTGYLGRNETYIQNDNHSKMALTPSTSQPSETVCNRTKPNDNYGSSQSNSSSSSTVGDNTEDIYEEVSNLAEISSNSAEFELYRNRQSGSQDTLIGISTEDGCNINNFYKDNDSNSEEDEDDVVGADDDRISMISQTSSSTFSSFTTCANQDFDFIVSQSVSSDSSSSDSRSYKQSLDSELQKTPSFKSESSQIANQANQQNRSQEPELNGKTLEPPTLSLAAIYYNRFILNESGDNVKSGHRQRPKLNRRQSFSTAYELRQRILHNQFHRQDDKLEDGNEMNFIEEENEENCCNDELVEEYPVYTTNLDELMSYKLNRRISTSEDNLLSIISTIAHCGDDTRTEAESSNPNQIAYSEQLNAVIGSDKDQNFNKTSEQSPQKQVTDTISSPNLQNGTFILKKEINNRIFAKNLNAKSKPSTNSAIPRPISKLPQPNVTSSKATRSTENSPTKITIRELKSKKQTLKSTGQVNKPSIKPIVSNSRVYELGSLWDRSSVQNIPKNAKSKSPGEKPINKPTHGKSSKSPTSSSHSSSSSASTPSSPSRVPTFISVSPLRTPKNLLRNDKPNEQNFASKLPAFNPYIKQKQNPRENAILAKNALLSSGMKPT